MVFDLEGAGPIAGLDYDDDHILHAPCLRFAVASTPFRNDGEDNRRLIHAVDAALALRGGGAAGGSPDVEALEINFVFSAGANLYVHLPPRGRYVYGHAHAADITSAHLAAWLGFAARHVTGSFTLAVPLLSGPEMKAVPEHKKKPRVAELPATARAETMSLNFGLARLAVPVPGAGAGYHALGDLLLSRAHIEPGGADERNLSRLLSAAGCPRLRRLRLEYITGLAALRLDPAAAALEELNLHYIGELSSLELDAPGLRQLRITSCFRMVDDDATVRISAPNLELLACDNMCIPDRLLSFHGAGNVRRLEKIFLWTHINRGHCNAGAIWLLQNCTAADSLDIALSPPLMKEGVDAEEAMSRVPQLDNITNLAIDVGPVRWHNVLKATLAALIAKCSRLESLSIDICSASDSCTKPCCSCNGKDIEKISMEYLREATITGYNPSKYHQSLVQFIMAGAPALEKVTLELSVGKELHEDIPCDRGRWAPGVIEHCPKGARTTVYQWTADKKRDEEEGSGGLILSRF